ncbi:hypothetical protein M441DRAFT_460538 [Trichoderma asperellum CBS 433.97]|uniref:Uncharacterized protein n=1 Tax=Trichoderma asperellum (strain ATCC 204424 / CBS 433.97 / NBRC 101777) TaxID=1042311 RepID=A0A2T3Z435_TRIA4|nr:hypothetical protein M441DRAFT_460538 [Trichoderma asperellum CBS 433.97]PTB39559.1 hypothetical protein M441DRAFT_460538 [Trichoderma asperellum CBS 433.97]
MRDLLFGFLDAIFNVVCAAEPTTRNNDLGDDQRKLEFALLHACGAIMQVSCRRPPHGDGDGEGGDLGGSWQRTKPEQQMSQPVDCLARHRGEHTARRRIPGREDGRPIGAARSGCARQVKADGRRRCIYVHMRYRSSRVDLTVVANAELGAKTSTTYLNESNVTLLYNNNQYACIHSPTTTSMYARGG